MISVDVRTRTASDVLPVDATDFFETDLPSLFADRAVFAAAGARELEPRPLAVEIDGRSWTLRFDAGRFTVSPGRDTAIAVVRLDAHALADLVNDLVTPMTFFTGGDRLQSAEYRRRSG